MEFGQVCFALAVFCFRFGLINAWGHEGHSIIAQIAADRIGTTPASIVQKLIGNETLADIAPLPDDYAHTPQGKWSEPCHYANLPNDATQFLMSYCGQFCITKSVQNYTTRLGKGNWNIPCDFDDSVEPCALEFLTHYVGDIHQPLHVGYGSDDGGNKVEVDFYGSRTNLHEVWDSKIIERWNGDMDSAVTELEGIIQANPAMVQQFLSVTNPILWANESFGFVRSTCYNFNATNSTDSYSSFYDMDSSFSTPDLADAYYDRNLPIIQRRLIAAGVRLGALLDSLLTMLMKTASSTPKMRIV